MRTWPAAAKEDRPGLAACLKAAREGDTIIIWKLDRLGRTLAHLVNTIERLGKRGIGLRVLDGSGAQIDTTTPAGRLIFGVFAAVAEFERDLIRERTLSGLRAARARGRKGGRKTPSQKHRCEWPWRPWQAGIAAQMSLPPNSA